MRTISYDEVVSAARAYWTVGKLQAQQPNQTRCTYTGPEGVRCAIGAVLTEEELEEMRNRNISELDVFGLESSGIFSAASRDDLADMKRLQIVHDNIIVCRTLEIHEESFMHVARFIELIAPDTVTWTWENW